MHITNEKYKELKAYLKDGKLFIRKEQRIEEDRTLFGYKV